MYPPLLLPGRGALHELKNWDKGGATPCHLSLSLPLPSDLQTPSQSLAGPIWNLGSCSKPFMPLNEKVEVKESSRTTTIHVHEASTAPKRAVPGKHPSLGVHSFIHLTNIFFRVWGLSQHPQEPSLSFLSLFYLIKPETSYLHFIDRKTEFQRLSYLPWA